MRRARHVVYVVRLDQPDYLEGVRLHADGTATVIRFLRPIYRFRPTASQRAKVRARKGRIAITESQYVR